MGEVSQSSKRRGDPDGKQPTRTRQEAEQVIRKVSKDLREHFATLGKAPKNPTELVVMQGQKFSQVCREVSECPTAKKGGAMCGDMGWMTPDKLTSMGGNFREKVEPLSAGQWSDITASDQGVHLIQR